MHISFTEGINCTNKKLHILEVQIDKYLSAMHRLLGVISELK